MIITEYDEQKTTEAIAKENMDEGRKEGLKKGENKLSQLINHLLSQNRITDVQKATSDEKERRRLYLEFGMTDEL